MKYSMWTNRWGCIICWCLTIIFLFPVIGLSVYFVSEYPQSFEDPLLNAVSFPVLVFCVSLSILMHRKYQLTDDGVEEILLFFKKKTAWNEIKYWGVFSDVNSRYKPGGPVISLILSTDIPLYPGHQYLVHRKKVVQFSYTEERYKETKKFADLYGIKQLTKDGKGKQYGALI